MAAVSIGMPVYNGEMYIRGALESLLSQSFSDFELIISDNASTDKTGSICLEYASKDKRIRYIRQSANIGATTNFKFVFDEATSEYFMWAACDDVRSNDFIDVNINFLKDHMDYVASASPNVFEGGEIVNKNWVNFKLDGDVFERFSEFFRNALISHGIFYSLIRVSALRNCQILGQSFIAFDWAINLYLASKGKINRTADGYIIFGIKGVSSSPGAYKAFRNKPIELIIPFYRLSKYVLSLIVGFHAREKIKIIYFLLKLNVWADFDQVRGALYMMYCNTLRPLVHRKRLAK